MAKRSPAQVFSDAASEVAKIMRSAAHDLDLCQDALGAHCDVNQTTAGKWMSSQVTDSIPLARLAMAPRDFVVGVCRGLLASRHAVVVDLLTFGSGEAADDVLVQMDRAQQAGSQALHAIIHAISDRVITTQEADAIETAIDAEITHLMSIKERTRRIQRNGAEGVGAVRLEAVR